MKKGFNSLLQAVQRVVDPNSFTPVGQTDDRNPIQRFFNIDTKPIVIEKNQPSPAPTQMPSPTPIPTQMPQARPSVAGTNTSNGRRLAMEQYQGGSTQTPFVPNVKGLEDLIWEFQPEQATPSAVALWGENAGGNLNAINRNNDGTDDYGLWQTNTKTFNDLMSKNKYRQMLEAEGINSINDLLGDARKSTAANRAVMEYENDSNAAPYAWYYGWQNKGATIDPNQSIEDLAAQRYPSGKVPYFKLKEFVERNR